MALGLVKQIVIAEYFGTTAQLDSFLIATAVPSVFSGIALSVFSSSLIPILTPISHVRKEFSQAVSTVTFMTLIFVAILIGVGIGGKELILGISTNLSDSGLALAARLAGYVWLITGFVILNALCVSLFNLHKQFIFAAVTGLFPTIGMILGTFFLGASIGIEGLVIGWLGMTVLSSLALLPVLVRCGVSWQEIRLASPCAREFLKALVLVSVGLLPFTVFPSLDAFWASSLAEGSMSYIGYCTRIAIGIASLVVTGVYAVILPHLSENVAANDLDAFWRRLRLAIKYVLLITIPLVTFFAFFGREVVTILFQRGHFSEESTSSVSSLLPFYLIGLLAMAPATILSRGYFALKRYRQFGLLSLTVVAVYFVVSGVLSRYYSFYGIGVTYAIYWVLFFSAGIFLLDRNVLGTDTLMAALKCGACSVVGSAVAYVVFSVSLRFPLGMTLLLEGCLATFLFLLLAHALRLTELDSLRVEVLSIARK